MRAAKTEVVKLKADVEQERQQRAKIEAERKQLADELALAKKRCAELEVENNKAKSKSCNIL